MKGGNGKNKSYEELKKNEKEAVQSLGFNSSTWNTRDIESCDYTLEFLIALKEYYEGNVQVHFDKISKLIKNAQLLGYKYLNRIPLGTEKINYLRRISPPTKLNVETQAQFINRLTKATNLNPSNYKPIYGTAISPQVGLYPQNPGNMYTDPNAIKLGVNNFNN